MFAQLFSRFAASLPFQCALCSRWPCAASAHGSCVIDKDTGKALDETLQAKGVRGICASCVQQYAKPPRFPTPLGLDAGVAVLPFESPWDRLIAHYKFAPEPALANAFAGLMQRDDRVVEMLQQADRIIALPLSRERLSARGFNQAHWLSKRVLKNLRLEHKLDDGTLQRVRDSRPQRGLDRAQRQRNVSDAFAVMTGQGKAQLQGQTIVLIDDVMTTGATLVSAAKPLRAWGAARIWGVTLAYTPLH